MHKWASAPSAAQWPSGRKSIKDGWNRIDAVTAVPQPPPEEQEDWQQFREDIAGKEVRPEQVRIARQEEMAEFRKHNVYEKMPIQECLQRTGRKPIGVRWVDINKGDEVKPKYRSRLVAKELKLDKREDLFAATPPVEAKKLLFTLRP